MSSLSFHHTNRIDTSLGNTRDDKASAECETKENYSKSMISPRYTTCTN